MASASSRSVPLPYGKKYYCNFIYNYAARRNLVTDDTKLSLKFVEFLVGKLKDWGYTQCYYYDENARPGADVFDQLFDAAKNSMLTLVILTEYFSQNLWVRYSGKAVFKTLIGENKDSRDKLIPIVLGNAPVPDELDVNDVLSFDVDENTWHDEKHEQQLKKLRRVLDEGVPRADIKFPIQDYGDGIQRSEGGHIIVNPLPSMPGASNITQDRNERQMESLSSSVAAIHISNTLALPPGSLATSSKALQDCETSPSFRTASTSAATTTTLQGSSTQTMQPATTSPTATLTPSTSTPQTTSVSATSTASSTTLIPTETMTGSSGTTSLIQETPTTTADISTTGHVMISYRRVEKEKAFWIKRVLQKNGYSVWIDEDNLGPRIFQGMANGVEGAHVVLLCMSEEYKKSDFCRSEAEQAKTLKKNILPVKVEDIKLDGWLGIVSAGYLFVDLSGPHPSEEQIELLLRKLAEYYSKEFQEPQIEPFVSNVVSQRETGSAQVPGTNQSAGSL